jgi:hypothetical protein
VFENSRLRCDKEIPESFLIVAGSPKFCQNVLIFLLSGNVLAPKRGCLTFNAPSAFVHCGGNTVTFLSSVCRV